MKVKRQQHKVVNEENGRLYLGRPEVSQGSRTEV
jgi:hypothetical protein